MTKFSVTLLLAAATLSLAACGDDTDSIDTSGPYDRAGNVSVQNAAPAPMAAPAPAPTPAPAPAPAPEPVREADTVFQGSGAK
ncbi:MAG: hypothetical protein V4621_03710 [Pseudomonadota bacterium]